MSPDRWMLEHSGRRTLPLLVALLLTGCSAAGNQASPTSPTPAASGPTGPRLLLAGQSNASFLAPLLSGVLDQSNIDGSVDYWLSSQAFASAARTPDLVALIWWQGGADVDMPTDEYARKLRTVITIARSQTPGLPVRIIELADFPIRVNVRAAQRLVAADPNVEMIPTADLELADAGGHYTAAGYQTVRDRIYRSLGR